MDQAPGVKSLTPEEVVYRRIAMAFVDGGMPQVVAFKPHETQDVNGLSLSRAAVGPTGAAATGRTGKAFLIAEAMVAEVEQIKDLSVHADTDDHALIPQMNSALRASKNSQDKLRLEEWARELHLLFNKRPIHGPLPGLTPAG
jgi:hypothetical protein